jgi:hypothetical protein
MRVITFLGLIFLFTACSTLNRNIRDETIQDTTPVNNRLLRENIQKAIEDEDTRTPINISLEISGGLPSEAYHFSLRVNGAGQVVYSYEDQLSNIEERTGTANVEPDQVQALLVKILASGLLDTDGQVEPVLPETVVGRLVISDGVSKYETQFAADPEQAETQGKAMQPALHDVVEALYDLGAEVIGVQSVRPS